MDHIIYVISKFVIELFIIHWFSTVFFIFIFIIMDVRTTLNILRLNSRDLDVNDRVKPPITLKRLEDDHWIVLSLSHTPVVSYEIYIYLLYLC